MPPAPDVILDRGIALDRASVRSKDLDGHLHVARSIISSAEVNPYRGVEIPNGDKLGLEPNRIYMLLRDPGALEAAAAGYHGKPLLQVHKAVTAAQHDKSVVVGTVMNPVWEAPDIVAELVVIDGQAIKDIESDAKSDLSGGYRYTPVMEQGVYNGIHFDGRMVDIVPNHVALVTDGRVSRAVVGDAKPEGIEMAKAAQRLLEIAEELNRTIVVLGKDSSMEKDPKKAEDAEKEFLKEKLNAEDWKAYDEMCKAKDAKRAKDEEESEEEKKKKEAEDKRAKDKRAKDKAAKDAEEDPDKEKEKKEAEDKRAKDAKKAKDEEVGDPGIENFSSGAMDQAVKMATDAAVKRVQQSQKEIREAERAVFPLLGHIDVAMDSAEDIYRAAIASRPEFKNDADGLKDMPLSALKMILKTIPVPGTPGSAPGASERRMAFDGVASAEADFQKMFPGAAIPRAV